MRSRAVTDSLPTRAFLLAYDVERQKLTGDQLPLVVRGALLADLSLRGCLTEDEEGKVRASGTRRTGDPVMDDVLRTIDEARPQPWRWWVRRGTRQTLVAVREQLATAGVVSVETERVLGIFRRTKVTVSDPAVVVRQRDSLRAVAAGTGPVSDQDATLVALVAVGEMGATLSRKDRKAHAARIKELTEQAGGAVPVLPKVLHHIKAARSAARSGG